MDYDHANQDDKYSVYFEKAYRELHSPLLAHGIRLTHNVPDAEDLVAETFLRVLRYPLPPQLIKDVKAYFHRVLKRVYLDKVRKERASETDSLDDPVRGKALKQSLPSVQPDIQQKLEDEEAWQDFWGGSKLTSRERLLFILYLQGLKCRDISELLHEDFEGVQQDMNRLLTKVKSRVKQKRKVQS
ncbi:MAG TPA: RNA polymerase sigma factor [Pyrinomonadaceae bacterium]|nr:RNA polymerase sigma factor [Pyrinomonadaceae bacterium]